MTLEDHTTAHGQPQRPKRKAGSQIKMPAKIRYLKEIKRLKARIKELEEQLSGGWRSDDGDWCDITYAARYIGNSPQTLRNHRSKGTGPVSFSSGNGVRYKVSLLEAYMETGYAQRDYDREHGK